MIIIPPLKTKPRWGRAACPGPRHHHHGRRRSPLPARVAAARSARLVRFDRRASHRVSSSRRPGSSASAAVSHCRDACVVRSGAVPRGGCFAFFLIRSGGRGRFLVWSGLRQRKRRCLWWQLWCRAYGTNRNRNRWSVSFISWVLAVSRRWHKLRFFYFSERACRLPFG